MAPRSLYECAIIVTCESNGLFSDRYTDLQTNEHLLHKLICTMRSTCRVQDGIMQQLYSSLYIERKVKGVRK